MFCLSHIIKDITPIVCDFSHKVLVEIDHDYQKT
jgi:hypothetical protein